MPRAYRADKKAEPMDRMTRGFHRIGLALAVPLALVSLWFLIGGYIENDSRTGTMFIGFCAATLAVLWYGICRTAAWVVNGFRNYGPTN